MLNPNLVIGSPIESEITLHVGRSTLVRVHNSVEAVFYTPDSIYAAPTELLLIVGTQCIASIWLKITQPRHDVGLPARCAPTMDSHVSYMSQPILFTQLMRAGIQHRV